MSSGTLGTDQKFTGQRQDSSGLYFMNARLYDPAIGRFISADTVVPSVGNPQALKRFSYALNAPTKFADPTGHSAVDMQGAWDVVNQRGLYDRVDIDAATATLLAGGVHIPPPTPSPVVKSSADEIEAAAGEIHKLTYADREKRLDRLAESFYAYTSGISVARWFNGMKGVMDAFDDFSRLNGAGFGDFTSWLNAYNLGALELGYECFTGTCSSVGGGFGTAIKHFAQFFANVRADLTDNEIAQAQNAGELFALNAAEARTRSAPNDFEEYVIGGLMAQQKFEYYTKSAYTGGFRTNRGAARTAVTWLAWTAW